LKCSFHATCVTTDPKPRARYILRDQASRITSEFFTEICNFYGAIGRRGSKRDPWRAQTSSIRRPMNINAGVSRRTEEARIRWYRFETAEQ